MSYKIVNMKDRKTASGIPFTAFSLENTGDGSKKDTVCWSPEFISGAKIGDVVDVVFEDRVINGYPRSKILEPIKILQTSGPAQEPQTQPVSQPTQQKVVTGEVPTEFDTVTESGILFARLKAKEIVARVATWIQKSDTAQAGVELLLYPAPNILAEHLNHVAGQFGWQSEYKADNNIIVCCIRIKSPAGNWIEKSDIGMNAANATVPGKGTATNGFERACRQWGLGCELCYPHKIFVPIENIAYESKGGQLFCNSDFYVSDVRYNGREISSIEIVRDDGKVVYKN